MVEVRDVIGVIEHITSMSTKDGIAKRTGNKFTTFNVGVKLDDDTWHNISEFKEEKVIDKLKSTELDRDFEPGDQVKIYEESKDGQYWNIKAMVALEAEATPALKKLEELEKDAPMQVEEIDMSGIEINYNEGKKEILAEEEKEKPKPKDKATISDYKIAEANKYSLGMALNNAAVILAGYSKKLEIGDLKLTEGLPVDKLIDEVYPLLVDRLYEYNLKVRKEKLGY